MLVDFYSAAALLAMQSAVIPTAIPSFRPSVRLSHAGTLSRRMNIGSRGLHCKVAKTFYYSDTNNGWGRRPLPLKFALKVTMPSEIRQLRPISAYNVSTVRASKKVQLSRVGSRLRAFQHAIDEARTSPLSSRTGG